MAPTGYYALKLPFYDSVQFSHSVVSLCLSCLTLCDPMDCSIPGFPVYHQLLEFTQTHVHWVGDPIQQSHPLSSVILFPQLAPTFKCPFPDDGPGLCVCGCMSMCARSVTSDFLWLHGLQPSRLPCLSPTPGVYSNSCPSSQWCHPVISSSLIPFSSCLRLSHH